MLTESALTIAYLFSFRINYIVRDTFSRLLASQN